MSGARGTPARNPAPNPFYAIGGALWDLTVDFLSPTNLTMVGALVTAPMIAKKIGGEALGLAAGRAVTFITGPLALTGAGIAILNEFDFFGLHTLDKAKIFEDFSLSAHSFLPKLPTPEQLNDPKFNFFRDPALIELVKKYADFIKKNPDNNSTGKIDYASYEAINSAVSKLPEQVVDFIKMNDADRDSVNQKIKEELAKAPELDIEPTSCSRRSMMHLGSKLNPKLEDTIKQSAASSPKPNCPMPDSPG